jgi:glycosyltransferase involved in cell wall biosynthesis
LSQCEVAVVIPCYRCADTILRAVASVDAQTMRPAELILVDDCSGDKTLDVLRAAQRNYGDDWIKIVALRENMGPGSARNAGWDIATQPYIAFLDADDVWARQKIEIQLSWMREHPEVILTGHGCSVIDRPEEAFNFELYSNPNFAKVSSLQLLISNRFPTRSVMLQRHVPHRFADGKRHSEDYLLWCEIALDGNQCFRSPLSLAFLFKAHYGQGGLSGDLLRMQKGQLDTYTRLFKAKKIDALTLGLLYVWSICRFMRRIVRARLLRPLGV